jgi:hypothetical protein
MELHQEFDESILISIKHDQLADYIERDKKLEKFIKKYEKIAEGLSFANVSNNKVNEIPFPDLLENLKKYPRFYK